MELSHAELVGKCEELQREVMSLIFQQGSLEEKHVNLEKQHADFVNRCSFVEEKYRKGKKFILSMHQQGSEQDGGGPASPLDRRRGKL